MSEWEFIVTDFVGADGEEGERYIWEAIVKALKGTGEGLGCVLMNLLACFRSK